MTVLGTSKGVDLGFIGHLLLATRSLLFKPHLGSLGDINKKNGDWRDGPSHKNKKRPYLNLAILRECDLFGMVSLRDPFKWLLVTSNRGIKRSHWITWKMKRNDDLLRSGRILGKKWWPCVGVFSRFFWKLEVSRWVVLHLERYTSDMLVVYSCIFRTYWYLSENVGKYRFFF